MSIREGKERLLKRLEEQEATRKRQWQPVTDRIADLEQQLSATQAELEEERRLLGICKTKATAIHERYKKAREERDELRESLAVTTDKYGKLALRADAVQKQHDEWCDIAESLRTECDRLKEDLSVNRQCYYEVVGQRNDCLKQIDRLESELAALRRGMESLIERQEGI